MKFLKVVRCYWLRHPLTHRVWIPEPESTPVKMVYSVEVSKEVVIDSSNIFLTYYHPACYCWKRISNEIKNAWEGYVRVSGSRGTFSIDGGDLHLGPLPFDVDIADIYSEDR